MNHVVIKKTGGNDTQYMQLTFFFFYVLINETFDRVFELLTMFYFFLNKVYGIMFILCYCTAACFHCKLANKVSVMFMSNGNVVDKLLLITASRIPNSAGTVLSPYDLWRMSMLRVYVCVVHSKAENSSCVTTILLKPNSSVKHSGVLLHQFLKKQQQSYKRHSTLPLSVYRLNYLLGLFSFCLSSG